MKRQFLLGIHTWNTMSGGDVDGPCWTAIATNTSPCVTRLLDEGHTVDLVYLDFAKAFDSVNHRFRSSGIDGAVLNWIKSYLSNQSYQVQTDDVLSEEAPCLSDVPKGSVICPLLFLLYINDLQPLSVILLSFLQMT